MSEITDKKHKNAELKDIFGDFYSPLHLLSYGRPWMITVGSRSIGKSTGWLIIAIRDFLLYGKRFIYVRRTDDEIKMTAPTACDSAAAILSSFGYPVKRIVASKGIFWLYKSEDENEKPTECGSYLALSLSSKKKSSNYGLKKYCLIIYDEFITLDAARYLGTKAKVTFEYTLCHELYVTVDRGIGQSFRNETNFVFIANNASYFNPIFIALGVDKFLRTDTKIVAPKGKLWVCEQTASVKATEHASESYGYQLAEESERAYAYENIAFDSKVNFVKVLTEPMQGRFNIKYNADIFGIFYVPRKNAFYISKRKAEGITVALTTSAQDEIDYMLSVRPTDSMYMRTLKELWYMGKVICENRRIRYIVANYFMLTP